MFGLLGFLVGILFIFLGGFMTFFLPSVSGHLKYQPDDLSIGSIIIGFIFLVFGFILVIF